MTQTWPAGFKKHIIIKSLLGLA